MQKREGVIMKGCLIKSSLYNLSYTLFLDFNCII
jgi:hypothetical protein